MPARPPAIPTASRLFTAAFGALLGLALVKFGNPVILSSLVEWPEGPWQWVFFAWPAVVAYPLLLVVLALGVWAAKTDGFSFRTLGFRNLALWLPLAWLAWQLAAAGGTIDHRLTQWTLGQFAAAVLCFYLGYVSLGGARSLRTPEPRKRLESTECPSPALSGTLSPSDGERAGVRGSMLIPRPTASQSCGSGCLSLTGFWTALLAGFAAVLVTGLEQHFGGLAASREHFLLYVQPGMKEVPPELMKRMTSGRIFGTLFYPNTLATVILLLLPALLAFLWSLKASLTVGARLFLMAALALTALACLVWSGSKGGWLVMMLLGLVALLQVRFARRWKLVLVGLVLVAGLTGFFWRYAAFFEKGATSVGARFDYWQAAAQTVRDHPWLGSGPGTFGVVYARVKRPDAEMSRMTHNDYLQQGSDSGLPGLLAYCGFVVLALLGGYPRGTGAPDWPRLAVWLGVLGWAVQSLFEFPLYIPATAWLPFALLGWLLREQVLRSSRLGG
jgi:O-antigen ligase